MCNEMNRLKVIVSGGGTGGHIFPAIAIADALKNRYPDADILFVGAEGRMEMKRVPAAGYRIEGLPVAGFNRKNLFKNFKVLYKLQKSLYMAKKIIKNFAPDIVIGVGGYASGPTLKIAASRGIPTLLQEQNSYPGVTNKLLAKTATKICVAYEGMERFFSKEKIVLTGNPCRQDLSSHNVTREDAMKHFDLDPQKKTLLIIGGSLGSKTINMSVSNKKELLREDVQIIWQSGEYYFHDLFLEVGHSPKLKNVRLFDFIDRMDLAYKAADLVISRAGAGSISELSLLEKPSILIPSPNVSEDHQTKNAMALVDKNAAILIKDEDAQDHLVEIAMKIITDDDQLKTLSENIAELAQHDSANRIVNEVVKIIAGKRK